MQDFYFQHYNICRTVPWVVLSLDSKTHSVIFPMLRRGDSTIRSVDLPCKSPSGDRSSLGQHHQGNCELPGPLHALRRSLSCDRSGLSQCHQDNSKPYGSLHISAADLRQAIVRVRANIIREADLYQENRSGLHQPHHDTNIIHVNRKGLFVDLPQISVRRSFGLGPTSSGSRSLYQVTVQVWANITRTTVNRMGLSIDLQQISVR